MKKILIDWYNLLYWKFKKTIFISVNNKIFRTKVFLNKNGFYLNAKQKAWKRAISEIGKKNIIILETGRSRNPDWVVSDGNSTWFFSMWDKIERLISIDNDTENYSGFSTSEEYCKKYLSKGQLNKIRFVNGDSRDEIKKLHGQYSVDAVLLDSANDPALILDECKEVLPLLNKPAVIIIDDVNGGGIKGNLAIPFLKQLGYTCIYFSAPPNYGCYFIIR